MKPLFVNLLPERFAFSPLSEEDEDDEQKEPMLKESFGKKNISVL